ncbi:hypothetical protein ACFQY8_02160 [Alloscardovia venturai]|uniref:Uncharacterized protein n=1 Tax=Alloscardovia venturai TaxID=1769421 RepID=A0ABW2Y3E0_9BIFI
MNTYKASNGAQFTDADINRWAQEAENNFADAGLEVTPVAPRAWEIKKEVSRPHTIRIADSLWKLIEQDADRKNMSVDDWIRNASTQALTHA